MWLQQFCQKNYDNYQRKFILYSESKREALYLHTNYSSKFRTQLSLPKATVMQKYERFRETHAPNIRQQRETEQRAKLSKYFIAVICDKSGNEFQLSSRDKTTQAPFAEYYKYLDTYYTNDENDIYYVILKYPFEIISV